MKETLRREMTNGFLHIFRSSLKDCTLYRDAEDRVFDPVTETYSGGSPPTTDSFKGLFRMYKESLVDGINIENDDVKLTTLQEWVTETPKNGDKINDTYRVVSVKEDTTEVFWTIQLRRLPND